MIRLSLVVLLFGSGLILAGGEVTAPEVPESVSPVEELRVSENAYAAVRKPPGQGPFPAVIFLHGGLGQASMESLAHNSMHQPTQSRFLAWGYVAVNSTRRAIRHDPQDRRIVDDVLELIKAVKKLPYVEDDSIALYGGSGGATLALEVASVSDLPAVVLGEPASIIYMGMFTKEHVIFDAQGKPTGDRRRDVMSADAKQLYTDPIRKHTRSKLEGLKTPVLILHGDVSELRKFNLDLLVPEMKSMGKDVTVSLYPGEPHGFYWGQGRDPAAALKANRDAEAYLRERLDAKPQPIAGPLETMPVKPMRRANPN